MNEQQQEALSRAKSALDRAIDAAHIAYGFGPRCSETAKAVEAEIDCALALINEARP